MIQPIVTYTVGASDNPAILQQETKPIIDVTDPEVLTCVQDLNDTLDDFIQRNGNPRGICGLSAPQINSNLAISALQMRDRRLILINPEIIEERGKDRLFRIGCFSLFDYRAMVRYNDDVVVRYLDEEGQTCTLAFTGDDSCVVQHELDHLKGWLLFERLPGKEADLFIPGQWEHPSKAVPVTVYYSSLFNDYTNYVEIAEKAKTEHALLLEALTSFTPPGGRILELGNGTGTVSIQLSKEEFSVCSMQLDEDMLAVDQRINEANDTNVSFVSDSNPLLQCPYDTVFSYERFQYLSPEDVQAQLKTLFTCCNDIVLELPVLPGPCTDLRGGEQLHTKEEWEDIFLDGDCLILDTYLDETTSHCVFVLAKADVLEDWE